MTDPIDIHTQTAMKLFKVAHPSELTVAQRSYAKQWNYIELYSNNVPLPERTTNVLLMAVTPMDLASAERLLALYHAKYGKIGLTLRDLSLEYKRMERTTEEARHNLTQFLQKAARDFPPAPRENLRHSSKTGKSWPKPKGSY